MAQALDPRNNGAEKVLAWVMVLLRCLLLILLQVRVCGGGADIDSCCTFARSFGVVQVSLKSSSAHHAAGACGDEQSLQLLVCLLVCWIALGLFVLLAAACASCWV